MPVFFASELEGVANFWRIYRKDGITLGFTSHDRALHFGGINHRSAPGMLPSAIRRTSDLNLDSAEVEGVLGHDSIGEADLAAGLFDGARIEAGAVDWETLEYEILYAGFLGNIVQSQQGFSAGLRSTKSILEEDLVPRTSPTCRAEFCGPGCNLSAQKYTQRLPLSAIDLDTNTVDLSSISGPDFVDGRLRFEAGPQAGLEFGIIKASGTSLMLDRPLVEGTSIGTDVQLLEGCDRQLTTCETRFANAINFRGEPFLPGNDLLARYANPR